MQIKNSFLRLLAVFVFLTGTLCLHAQETIVVGQVINTERVPLEGVNVTFKNTTIGMQTNEEGYFMIRAYENVTAIEFSYLGYKKQEIKIKQGQYAGVEVVMEEQVTWLPEVFVLPGANPALELMRNVRIMRGKNNLSNNESFSVNGHDKNAVFLTNLHQSTTNKHIWERLKKGNISTEDSTLIVPLFHSSDQYLLTGVKKTETKRELFETDKTADRLVQQMLLLLDENINFYNNTIVLFGRSFVSPLANVGNSFYKYYLADSTRYEKGKIYEVHFRSVNKKNLAFNGKLWVDSANYALTGIEAELPLQANINYVKNMYIKQKYSTLNEVQWYKNEEQLSLNLDYSFFQDSVRNNARLLMTRNSIYNPVNSAVVAQNNLESEYSDELIAEKMAVLQNDPLFKAAMWIADIALTGNAKFGKIDVGNVKDIIRVTDIEGWRFAIPLQTNEDLMKNIAVGGHLGYGIRSKEFKYSAFSKIKLPGKKKRTFELNYTNDYRRIDYDYNDFLFRENTFPTDDEDIVSTVFSFRSAKKMNERKELSFSYFNEWNDNTESTFYLRSYQIFADNWVPFVQNNTAIRSFTQQSFTASTRFSFNERTYEDHLQRIYLPSHYPVFYAIGEVGKYKFGEITDNYGKITAILRHTLPYELGQWNYMARADWVIGRVPYPLLSYVHGNETDDYNLLKFSMLNYMQFPSDRSIQLHNEFIFNGILMNRIPYIQNWNFREIISLKLGYGMLNKTKHADLADFPSYMHAFDRPYAEFGVGITNILRFFSVQSLWATPNYFYPNKWRWSAQFYFTLGF